MKQEYTIENYKLLNKGKLIAAFDLTLASGLRINGLLLFEKDGARWVNFPSRKFKSEDGQNAYAPIVELRDRGKMNAFRDGVLAAIDAQLKPKAEPAGPPRAEIPVEDENAFPF